MSKPHDRCGIGTDRPHAPHSFRRMFGDSAVTTVWCGGYDGSRQASADHRAVRGWPIPSDTLSLTIPAVGERFPGTCWDCGHDVLMIRPDQGMGGMTDEVVCGACGEAQVTA